MDWLKELSDDWKSSTEKVKDLKKISYILQDGNYKATITSAVVDEDRPMIKFGLLFPQQDGPPIARTKVIFVSGKLEYVHRELGVIGCDTDDLSNLSETIQNAVGKIIDVTVRTPAGEKYAKIYFNRDTGERSDESFGGGANTDSPQDW